MCQCVGGRVRRVEGLRVSVARTADSADLGVSSNYTSEILVD